MNSQSKILVVDDDEVDREAVRRFLDQDYEVAEAGTLDEALAYLQQREPVCALLDERLPDGTGSSIVSEFVDRLVPVVILTGQGNESLAVEVMKAGAQDYLVKSKLNRPLLLQTIQAGVDKMDLRRRLLSKEEVLKTEVLERRRIEKALRETNDRLQEAIFELESQREEAIRRERMSALGVMASGIAHDLNNALVPALGYTDIMLLNPEALPEETVEDLKIVQTSLNDAVEVLKQLRWFYRDGASKVGRVLLSDVLEKVVDLTRPRWRDELSAAGIQVEILKQFEDDVYCLGDDSELRQLALNLMLNSIDAMPEGGTLTLKVGSSGHRAWFEVSDTGVGMSEETRERCLEPFYTTKGEKGTGMGLAMVFGIVKRHNGDLEILPGSPGTTIRVSLPLAVSEVEKERELEVQLPNMSILLVEDEKTVRRTLVAILESLGQVVEEASHVDQALDLFSSARHDLIITDLGMPDKNGDELARAVRQKAKTPIVMLTGFGELMKAKGEVPPEVNELLAKPVTSSDLKATLLRVVSEFPYLRNSKKAAKAAEKASTNGRS